MNKRCIALSLSVLAFVLLLAGCGKASSMKNYRKYVINYVETYITDEDTKDAMIKEIGTWRTQEDFSNFYNLYSYAASGYYKTYDYWVSAGCPTPTPTPSYAVSVTTGKKGP